MSAGAWSKKPKGGGDFPPAGGLSGGPAFLVLAFAAATLVWEQAQLGAFPLHLAGFAFLGLNGWFGRGESAALPDVIEAPPQVPGEVPRALWPSRTPAAKPVDAEEPVEADEVAVGHPDEASRLLAHVCAANASDRQARRILVTHAPSSDAPLAGVDCAAFASQFARSLALEGRTILVVFGAASCQQPGLAELIAGTASFSQAIHRECGSRLHVLPPGHGRAPLGNALHLVIDALSETYDFVVLAAADEDPEGLRRLSLALASRADHVLIGCAGQTGSPDMVSLRDALHAEGAGEVIAARIGVALSDAREAA